MATITNEAINKLLEPPKLNIGESSLLNNKDDRYNIITNALHTENYIVTPREIDNVILKISEIIARGLNAAI